MQKTTINRTFQIKDGKNWKETYRTEEQAKVYEVYEDLACELLNLKVFKSPAYKRLTQHPNYDGTRTVVIYQDAGRSVYVVKA